MACLIVPAEIRRPHEPLLWRGSFTLTEAEGELSHIRRVKSWRPTWADLIRLSLLHHLTANSVCVPLPWSQCRFATQLDARPPEPIAQGEPDQSMWGFERAAKRRCHSS
jgi:hypothetical protein